jgi:hypothetical protein
MPDAHVVERIREKYAAVVSTMTFERAEQIHAEF